MGGPMRPTYEHEAMPHSVNGSYGQPYPQDPRVAHYPPPQYAPYPGPPPPAVVPRQDGYYGQNPRRSRGGGSRDGGSRGRGGHHGGDKARQHKPVHQEANHKPETAIVGKKKKRKMNTLGLTPGMESESEDDEGEEKVLTDLIGQETLK